MSAAAFDSERLRMRPQQIDDADALFEAYSDAELMRYWSSGPHADIDETPPIWRLGSIRRNGAAGR
jgi:RimJ/RimL family protein N-acetyltransferase